ncbi:hypothetical protein IFM89_034388 [Coptis chinensis]|uniref:Uncharacterized protein n=1 Tax=Coptis chinensis TaxID=261450 RepID=A0A835MGM9_9MAGN|nr:hypothetical protein IFM89_034388 [Coptis chinensis]
MEHHSTSRVLASAGVGSAFSNTKHHTDIQVTDINGSAEVEFCSIKLPVSEQQESSASNWMGPVVKMSLPSYRLWDLLLKFVDRTRKRICPSYPKNVYTRGYDGVVNDKHRVRMLKGLQSHAKGNDNILCNDEKEYYSVTFAPKPVSLDDIEVSEGSERRSTRPNNSRNGINDSEVQTQFFRDEISKKYGQVSKCESSRVIASSGVKDVVVQVVKHLLDGLPPQGVGRNIIWHLGEPDPKKSILELMYHLDVFAKGFLEEGMPFADDYYITKKDGVSFIRYQWPLDIVDEKYDIPVNLTANMMLYGL